MIHEENSSDSAAEGVDLKILKETPVGKGSPDISHDEHDDEHVINIFYFSRVE